MFDCSIFTEYDDRDLSSMSENISNKWRSRLTKEQSKKLKKSRSEQTQTKVMTLTKEEKKQISIANETMDLVSFHFRMRSFPFFKIFHLWLAKFLSYFSIFLT